MVEINNQRKAFLDMLAWSEGTDNGRQKTRNHGYDVSRRRAIYWLLRSPSQTCHAKPKTQINRRRTLPALFPLVGCLPQAAWPGIPSPKSQDAVALQQIKERGALPMIDRGDIRQAIDRCSNIWASLPGAGYGQFEHKADSLIAKFKEAGGTVRRDWCMSRVTRLFPPPLWLSASSSACHGLLIITDNAIAHKAQRDKNARESEAGERAAITGHADASAWCCCARCVKYTKELADAKAENDALRDDVAAGRRRLHIKAVCQSVREATTASGVDNAASPRLADTAERGLFLPSERGWSLCKNNWKEPRSILMIV